MPGVYEAVHAALSGTPLSDTLPVRARASPLESSRLRGLKDELHSAALTPAPLHRFLKLCLRGLAIVRTTTTDRPASVAPQELAGSSLEYLPAAPHADTMLFLERLSKIELLDTHGADCVLRGLAHQLIARDVCAYLDLPAPSTR